MPCSQAHASLKAPLEAVEEGGGGFAEGEAVALGRGQGWGNGKGDHLEPLVLEGSGGAGGAARGR